MRSKMMALALAAATAAPAAAVAEVSLYGRAHVSVDHLDDGADSGLNVSSNSSRLGFKADRELPQGMKALMQIEQEVRFDQTGTNFATRDTFAGLSGDFGLVRLGYMDTPLKGIRSRTDLFGDQIGDARNLTRLSELGADFDTRFRNGIHYRTPAMGGLTADLHYATNNAATSNPPDDENSAWSAALTYRVGGTYLAIAHEDNEANDFNATRLGAYQDFGAFRVTGLVQRADIGYDVDTYGIGLRYKMGNTSLKTQYYVLSSDQADADAAMLALGVDYQLDRATRVYAAMAMTRNDDNAAFRMSRGGHGVSPATVTGETARGVSVGMMYNF
ncbi:porin [Ectothiorhodospiraceae bacterium 2226]|nr:porin [Ectothiorhodospiraceae bacterium 2226]